MFLAKQIIHEIITMQKNNAPLITLKYINPFRRSAKQKSNCTIEADMYNNLKVYVKTFSFDRF